MKYLKNFFLPVLLVFFLSSCEKISNFFSRDCNCKVKVIEIRNCSPYTVPVNISFENTNDYVFYAETLRVNPGKILYLPLVVPYDINSTPVFRIGENLLIEKTDYNSIKTNVESAPGQDLNQVRVRTEDNTATPLKGCDGIPIPQLCLQPDAPQAVYTVEMN